MTVVAWQLNQAVAMQAAQRMEVYARRVLKTICRSAHVRLHSALLTGLTDDLPLRTWATASSTLRVSLVPCSLQAARLRCILPTSLAGDPTFAVLYGHCLVTTMGSSHAALAVHPTLCPCVSVPHQEKGCATPPVTNELP